MDVFLMIRRKKTTIFTDVKETTSVHELKKIIEGITKKAPEKQRLYKDEIIMEDHKTLADYGLLSSAAKAQSPATVSLAFKLNDDEFEPLEVASLSSPPELPDVMKVQDSQPHEQTVS